MKKLRKIAMVILLAVVLTMTFVACGNDTPTDVVEKNITVILANNENIVLTTYSRTTKATVMKGVLDEMALDTTAKFSYEISGGFINSFKFDGVVYPNVKDAYVMCYTSITDVKYLTPTFTTIVNGVQYNSCGLGASEMPVIDGATYVYNTEVYKG